jgi:benzoate/toluate 1,2-dioxygenase reductase subunit
MDHTIALNFEDGVTRFVACPATETVADASYRAGINIPLDCRDGACGTCKAFCESGSFESGFYIEDALTDDEARQGFCLPCQMKPTSDLVVRIAAASTACKVRPVSHRATVVEVREASSTTFELALRLEDPAGIAFLPGQYVNIDVPGTGLSRAYSFSSRAGSQEVSFLIRRIPGGLMSTWLAAAKPGAAVTFTGPYGSFYLRDVVRPVLMLAGGTGLAPFLAMLEQLSTTGEPHPIHLVYGVTRDEDLVGTQRLDAFAAALPGFTWQACVADEASAYPRKGYVTAFVADRHLNEGDVDVYLCGPPAMVEAVRQSFATRGVAPASFHAEKFNPSQPLPSLPLAGAA